MSKNKLRSSGKHRRCDFANGAGELYCIYIFLFLLIDGPCRLTDKLHAGVITQQTAVHTQMIIPAISPFSACHMAVEIMAVLVFAVHGFLDLVRIGGTDELADSGCPVYIIPVNKHVQAVDALAL